MKKYLILFTLVVLCLLMSSMTIDLGNLLNYSNQYIPPYITKDNTGINSITDEGATLGRVLFYDKKLSSDNTIACGSCHLQEFAFSDTSLVSLGVNGVTGRHSMRLVNNRFADEEKYFWDERAVTLEAQSTMPIMDHFEMGYSGSEGDPDFQSLLDKLNAVPYYNDLFHLVFGDTIVTEQRMQIALAQFIRSIQSFDSPYDLGRSQVDHDSLPFPNFTQQQNSGKSLFITPTVFDNNSMRIDGGFGCASCHRPPEFDIDPESKSNGVIFTPGIPNPMGGLDTTVVRSPSLRDVVNHAGQVNGDLMHTANFANLTMVLNHYNATNLFPQIDGAAAATDPRLLPNGMEQNLNMTTQEQNQLIEFIGTLTGIDVYTNEKWSDPFDENGNLELINSPLVTSSETLEEVEFNIFPNPVIDELNIKGDIQNKTIHIYSHNGRNIQSIKLINNQMIIPFNDYSAGSYLIILRDVTGKSITSQKLIKI